MSENLTPKELRSFGYMMGGILSLFTLIFFYKKIFIFGTVLGSIALTFAIMAFLAPLTLEGVHRRWMKFAQVIGNFNMKLILSFIYLTGFSLVRFVFLITGKDPMHRKFDQDSSSYWVDHPAPSDDPKRYEKQY